jgi:hypothetical protein
MSDSVRDLRTGKWAWFSKSLLQKKLGWKANIVYMSLVSFADGETQSCYPSLKTIAERVQVSKDTVIRGIKDLEAAEVIRVDRRTDERGNIASIYNLLPILVANSDKGVADSDKGGCQKPQGVVANSDPNNNQQHQEENNSAVVEQEEAIYQLYPRRVGKRAALKAIQNAVKRLVKNKEADTPLTARRLLYLKTKAYAAAPAGQNPSGDDDYRPHPAKWFNQEYYLDDPAMWQKPNGGRNGYSTSQSKQDATIAAGNAVLARIRGVGNNGVDQNRSSNGRASERGASCIDGERVAGYSS